MSRAQAILTIGSFDGVHRGHAALIRAARARADELGKGTRVVAMVFDPHPMTVLNPAAVPARLTAFETRRDLILALGADEVVRLEPKPQLLGLSAEAFIERVVKERHAVGFVEGPDFRFGQGRQGDAAMLVALGAAHDFECRILDPISVVLDDHSEVAASSTLCRWLISQGRVHDARLVLGRPHTLVGKVVQGDRRGRTIGFPTANIECEVMLPADGVYAGVATLDDGRRFGAAINVGERPTFEGAKRTVEAHLIDSGTTSSTASAWAPLPGLREYGWRMKIDLLAYLRDSAKFAGLDALRAQLARDCNRARDIASDHLGGHRSRATHDTLSPATLGRVGAAS